MAAVPIAITCIVYPRNKTDAPYPATIVGYSWNPGLEVGGGPILPPDEVPKPEPPLEIWPPDAWIDVPAHPIVIPDPPLPPIDPPATPPPPHEGWNWSAAKSGWYYLYVPGPGQAGPKRR